MAKRKFNTIKAEFEVEEDFDTEDSEEMNKSTENNDITTEESSDSDKEFEYYVSGTQALFGSYKPGDAVPEEMVNEFYLKNGHISKRLKGA